MNERGGTNEYREVISSGADVKKEIYSQTEDAVLKTMIHYFKDELLPYLGIKGKAVGIAATEVVYLGLKKLLQDFNLVMEDGSWSHFEFQSKNEGLEGLKRFRAYEAVTSYQNHVEVTTYVLFSGTIQNPMTEFTEGMNTYRIHPVIMTNMQVEELVEKLQKKTAAGEKLTKQDLVPMTLCSLMGGKLSQKERITKAFEFSRQAEKDIPKEEINKIEAVMYAMAEKFLNEVDMEEVREAVKMTKLGTMLINEGREEGREEGRCKNIISLVLRKIRKGYSAIEIADILEEDKEVVKKIYDIAISEAPEYDEEKIYRRFRES